MARSGYFSGPQNEYGTLSSVVLPDDGKVDKDPDQMIQRQIEATTSANTPAKPQNKNG